LPLGTALRRIAPPEPLAPGAATRIARPSAGYGSHPIPKPDRVPGVPPTGGLGPIGREGGPTQTFNRRM
jgi:hypothetical protein